MLPSQIFFEPTEDFIAWCADVHWLRYRRIVDCGAATGHLGAILLNDVHGIDLIPRSSYESPVKIADSTSFWFKPTDVVFLCRPCHSVAFIDRTLIQAIDHGVQDLFYIGLPKNVEEDLEDFSYQIEREDVGLDGEHMYRILCQAGHGFEYVKIESDLLGERKGKLLMRNGEAWLVNEQNGGFPLCKGDTIIYTLEANSVITAFGYRSPNDYRPKEKNYGWISPDGIFYPCGSADHDTMIYETFGLDSIEERNQNWVKVASNRYFPSDYRRRPNSKQLRKLRALGFDTSDEPGERGVDTLSATEQRIFASI